MRFSERDRPRPRRQEDYETYAERDMDDGWPYGDEPAGSRRAPVNGPYDDGPSDLDEEPGMGFQRDDGRARWRGMERGDPYRRGGGGGTYRGSSGGHHGKAPRGYTRSDERILEDVSDRLTLDPDLDPSDVEVVVKDREVTLNGTVSERHEKRLAEDLAEAVSGVIHVQNNIRRKQTAE